MHLKGCPQPIDGVLDIEVIDQFHRYNTFGYGVKINVDQSKNPQKDKKYSIALNLRSIRFVVSHYASGHPGADQTENSRF